MTGSPPVPSGFEATGAPLGAGATAVVWPVRRVADGREFALKVWRRPFADAHERDRFRREVRQHADVNRVSGHVVTYAWSEEDPADGTPWIGTEQHGTSLRDVLENGRPALPEALVLGGDILRGLSDMHRHGTLHRDVKPANVLVRDGRAMLCDLGLVMDAASYTDDNAAGTTFFVAPELMDGTTLPSPRTDVYSAARTLREALGRDLPPALEQLLTAAASVNPADRPRDAGELASQYSVVCGGLGQQLPSPLVAPRPGPSSPAVPTEVLPGRPWRSRRALGLMAAAGALVIAIAVTAAVVVPDEAEVPAVRAFPAFSPSAPDAGQAEPDITSDGRAVVLSPTTAGRCEDAADGATFVDEEPYEVEGTVVAVIRLYYESNAGQGCAKLVKPPASPYVGVRTHLALTLCGDANACDHDWNAYPTDAGPVVVPSKDGCLSYRVSMLDETGTNWLVEDAVGWVGCD